MQNKTNSDRFRKIDLEVVLVNRILGLDHPFNKESLHLIHSQDGEGHRRISGMLEQHFRIESNGEEAYSFPIGTLQDVSDDFVDMISRETIKVGVSKDIYNILLTIKDILEDAGVITTVSAILKFIIWTKYPFTILPNGELVGYGTALWFFDSEGNLLRYRRTDDNIKLRRIGACSINDIAQCFNMETWNTSVDATSTMITPSHRVSLLTVEVVRRVDDSYENGSVDGNIIFKEDTNNESIKDN